MTLLESTLEDIIHSKIFRRQTEDEYLQFWKKYVLDQYQELNGVTIPYHMDEWEDIYGIQYFSLESAIESILKDNLNMVRHIYHSQRYLDHEFNVLEKSPELPPELMEEFHQASQELTKDYFSLENDHAFHSIASLDILWSIWEDITNTCLEALINLDDTVKNKLKEMSDEDFRQTFNKVTHETARRVFNRLKQQKKAA